MGETVSKAEHLVQQTVIRGAGVCVAKGRTHLELLGFETQRMYVFDDMTFLPLSKWRLAAFFAAKET